MIPLDLAMLANHLWQSTLFTAAVWLITLCLRRNRAAVRHWLWLAASVKFLIPFSILVGIGGYFETHTASISAPPQVATIVVTISQPFAASAPLLTPVKSIPASQPGMISVLLFGVWICGFLASLFWWVQRWLKLRGTMQRSTRFDIDVPIRVMICGERLEPGVFGIFRPVLLLPDGITDWLSPPQLQAVLAHELSHVRRRDNMIAALHMFVEALFWFHPLLWWIRVRLIDEQERACDEEVLRLGGDPQIYAESILKVSEFCLTSPLMCVSGIAGSNLKKRIGDIMRNRVVHRLSLSRALLLAVAAIVALAGPILVGIVNVEAGGGEPAIGSVVKSGPQAAQLQAPQSTPSRVAIAPQAGTRESAGRATAIQQYRVGEIKITGVKVMHSDVVRSLLGLTSGEAYDESRLLKGFQNLTKLYGSFGHVNFLPEPVLDFNEQQKVVNLTVNIDEGLQYTVSRISFTGNTTTRDEVIRREILFKEGDVFNVSLLELSVAQLNQLGVFEEIRNYDVLIQPSTNEPKLDVNIRVKEKG